MFNQINNNQIQSIGSNRAFEAEYNELQVIRRPDSKQDDQLAPVATIDLTGSLNATTTTATMGNEQSTAQSNEFEYKEGGWVVVVATSYCFGILIGMINNYALVYDELINVYKTTENHVVYAGKFKYSST